MLHGIWYQLEEWIKRYLIQTYHRLSQEYFKSYRIALGWLYGLILNNYPVTYSFHGVFFDMRYHNVTWNLIQNWRIESRDILFKLTTGYLKSISSQIEQLLGWLYGLILNNYPVTYSFIGIFFSCSMIMLHGIWYKLEDWIKRYLIQTYHRLSQEYFKSYRIAFRVALWLDFEQLSSYLFISRCLFRAAISKYYMEFDTKLEYWIKGYLIQTYHRFSQEYFKSYRIAFRVALWLDFEQLSSYLFVNRHFF